jgi:hypothetical protein
MDAVRGGGCLIARRRRPPGRCRFHALLPLPESAPILTGRRSWPNRLGVGIARAVDRPRGLPSIIAVAEKFKMRHGGWLESRSAADTGPNFHI